MKRRCCLPGKTQRHHELVLCLLALSLLCCTSAHHWADPGTEPEQVAPASGSGQEQHTYSTTIKWVTASEVDNFGFDVYRGEAEDGPFERISSEPIAGGGTTDEPQHYRWVDDTLDPRITYYYFVESISMAGIRERFTPVAKVAPKIRPEEAQRCAAE